MVDAFLNLCKGEQASLTFLLHSRIFRTLTQPWRTCQHPTERVEPCRTSIKSTIWNLEEPSSPCYNHVILFGISLFAVKSSETFLKTMELHETQSIPVELCGTPVEFQWNLVDPCGT